MGVRKTGILFIGLLGAILLCVILKTPSASITLESLFAEEGEDTVFQNFAAISEKSDSANPDQPILLEGREAHIVSVFEEDQLQSLLYVFQLDGNKEEEALAFYDDLENKLNQILGPSDQQTVYDKLFDTKSSDWNGVKKGANEPINISLTIQVDSYLGDYVIQMICSQI